MNNTTLQRAGLQSIQASSILNWLDNRTGRGEAGTADCRLPLRRLVQQTLLATTMLCPLLFLTMQGASAQTRVGPGSISNYSLDGSGHNGSKGSDGNPGAFKNHDGGQGTIGGPGSASSTEIVNDTTISLNGGIAVQIFAPGGSGGAGGNGETTISGQSGNGGAGNDGGAGGAGQLTLDSGASVQSGSGQAILLSADGGTGGAGGQAANSGTGGKGGAGGAAASVTLRANAGSTIKTSGTTGSAVLLEADGGTPGLSQVTSYDATSGQHGPDGAPGGAGGAIQAVLGGTITAADTAVFAQSRGADGGTGANASDQIGSAYGGNGGTGGNGGDVKLQFLPGSSTTGSTASTNSSLVAAGLGLSTGGAGGNGGASNGGYGNAYAGKGGASGNGGPVEVDAQGAKVVMTGATAAGLLAESIGGEGGSAGSANSIIHAKGGNGAAGGSGGNATVHLTPGGTATTISTAGSNAAALVAQSIGGGGGYGGNADAASIGLSVAIGGSGGTGGAGGSAIVEMTSGDPGNPAPVVLTTGLRSPAMLAQSIGGGGGNGGSASTINAGIVNLTIGGSGGSGGVGGQTFEYNLGTLQTEGNHSSGMEAQSVGGGGGNGGSANSLQVGAQLNIAVTLGGSGGMGGNAGPVFTTINSGQIVTMGSDSYGIQAQSIGGGGGNGGASFSEAVQLFSTAAVAPEVPSALVNVTVGGSGGTAGNGGNVTADNENAIITEGAQSYGIFAQSVGGGGGSGGDSSAVNITLQAPTVSSTTVIGGSGGAGGQGGNVTATNNGLILSLGAGADGMLAQSVGGGGGNGGYAQADTGAFLSSDKTVQVTVTVGGSGGSGGAGGTVEASNTSGGIVTRGDGASGMFAQSIGGGGGTGNFSKALGSGGGTVNVNVAVGGGGGGGGGGGAVTADNHGAILTTGASAPGIAAQSVGGGGGKGGTAASGAGTDPEVRAADYIASGLGIGAGVINDGNGIYTLKDNTHGDFDVLGRLVGIVTGYNGQNDPKAPPAEEGKPEESPSFSVDVGAGFAGNGGSAGSGGKVVVTNEGSIQTVDTGSDGVEAQSIGGGGGDGGASNPAPSNNQLPAASAISAAIGVGGRGGSSGNGGEIDVTDTGSITTAGDLANGIHAQSIGAGGGTGGLTLAQNGVLGNLTLSIGGDGGSNGDGGPVNVRVAATSANGTGLIATTGRDASDILAQSIGGGGGLSSLMGTTVPDNSGGRGQSNTSVINSTTLPGSSILNLKIDGAGGSSGNGGPITVTLDKSSNASNAAYLQTLGVNSYAVLAQSIGGGGGLVIGVPDANALANVDRLFSAGASKGNGGTVAVTVEQGFSIGTGGAGGVGILAQSIGGGGGLIGGLSNVNLASRILPARGGGSGQGGDVTVDLESSANLATSGAGAHGIAAMSLGGGGGILDEADADGFAFAGSQPFNAPGAGFAPTGTVTIILGNNTLVRTTGSYAYSIYAASQGNGTNAVKINIGPDGYVESWANSAGAILVNGAGGRTDNVITNAGTIDDGTSQIAGATRNKSGIAILGEVPLTVNNTGTINGSTQAGDGSIFNNEAGGVFNAGSVIELGPSGQLSNRGLLAIGSASDDVTTTQLTGNLSQGRTGTILVRLDAHSNQADQLHVTGTAQLSGQVALQVIDPADLKPGNAQVNILTADGGVATSGLRAALAASPVLQYAPIRSRRNDLAVSYTVDFSGGGLLSGDGLGSGNRLAVGGAINAIQGAGGAEGIDGLIASLAQLRSAQALADLYDSLSGAATADAQQVLFGAQQAYQSTITQHVWNQAGPGSAAVSATSFGSGQPTEVWVGGLGRTDLLDGSDGQRSLHAQTAGALIGIDHSTEQGLTYGLSMGGGSSDFSVSQENSRGHDTSVNVAAYALARRGEIYLSSVLSYGNFSTDLHRYNVAGLAGLLASGRETFDSNVAGGRVELGWTHGIGALTMTPYAAVDLDELWQGGFSEDTPSGSASAASGLALRYGSVSQLSAPLTLGARLSTSQLLGGTRRFTPYLDLGWVHEFNSTRSVNAAFVAEPNVPFKVTGVAASRNAALTNIGGTFSLARQLSLLASVNGQFSGVETSYGGFGGIQFTW